jgi:CBS domain-containing protein
MEEAMKVKEVMTPNPKWIGPNVSITEAAKLMRESDIGCVPVGQNDRLVGMLTDRDIACRSAAEGRDPKTTNVGDVMTKGVTFCIEDASIDDAARLMEQKQIRRLPVLNSKKRMVGIVTVGDIAERASQALVGEVMHEVCRPSRGTQASA